MTTYRVLRGVSFPTAPGVVRRLLAGEDVPPAERQERYVPAGTITADIPPHSIAALLEKGCIEEVTDGA